MRDDEQTRVERVSLYMETIDESTTNVWLYEDVVRLAESVSGIKESDTMTAEHLR